MTLPRTSFVFACIAVSLLASAQAMAQRVVQGDLQQQMTDSEFKAAGLDKLSAAELTTLNNWLQGNVERAAASAVEQAREEGRQEVIVKHRGFLDFGSREPIESAIAGEFGGFGTGRTFSLENGQQWEQVDGSQLSGARRQSPKVKITPGVMGAWYLQVENFNTRAKVRRIK